MIHKTGFSRALVFLSERDEAVCWHTPRMVVCRLVLLLVGLSRQSVPQKERECLGDFECRNRFDCPDYQLKLKELQSLTRGSTAYSHLLGQLSGLICNKREGAVCCRQNYELVGGAEVTQVKDFPFMAYIHIRNGVSGSVECGASLVNDQFLATAWHCLRSFDESCFSENQCFACFRKLNKKVFKKGEMQIDILSVFQGPGDSDLALLKLITPVSAHPDYHMGVPLQGVQLAEEPPRIGDRVSTAGWGRTGYDEKNQRGEAQSRTLMSLELVVKGLDDRLVYTEVTNSENKITDTCEGRMVGLFNSLTLVQVTVAGPC